jgi:hypothetical protein
MSDHTHYNCMPEMHALWLEFSVLEYNIVLEILTRSDLLLILKTLQYDRLKVWRYQDLL